jgi:hypothetical protein
MPRKKRQNVPYHRKRQRTPAKPLLTNENTTIAQSCLNDEFEETLNTSNELCDHVEEQCIDTECTTTVHVHVDPFTQLKKKVLEFVDMPFVCNPNCENIQIVQLYPSAENVSVKLNITINSDYSAKIYVHRIELDQDHDLWIGLPKIYDSLSNIQSLLAKLISYSVCTGNHEQEFIDLTPVGSAIEHHSKSTPCHGYREGDFGAVKELLSYSSTVRNVKCALLVQGNRCSPCSHLRRILICRKNRLDEKRKKSDGDSAPNYLSKNFRHCNMSREELIGKIFQQKEKINNLQDEIGRVQRQFQKDVANSGVTLNTCQSMEMKDAMAVCTDEMEKAFPDANSYQRLFWCEQFKSINVNSSKGMRWHPMILRWCLYLRQKSNTAYDALRDSGFITLPSTRTLFDYSHYTKSG